MEKKKNLFFPFPQKKIRKQQFSFFVFLFFDLFFVLFCFLPLITFKTPIQLKIYAITNWGFRRQKPLQNFIAQYTADIFPPIYVICEVWFFRIFIFLSEFSDVCFPLEIFYCGLIGKQ